MQLTLKRTQVTRNRRAWFNLHCQLTLTEAEQELVRRYGMPMFGGLWSDNREYNEAQFTNLLRPDGSTVDEGDVLKIMDFEKRLRDACEATQTYWQIAQSFGGDTTEDF